MHFNLFTFNERSSNRGVEMGCPLCSFEASQTSLMQSLLYVFDCHSHSIAYAVQLKGERALGCILMLKSFLLR